MASVNFTKTSGIIQVRTVGNPPKIYISPRGTAEPNAAGTGVNIMINGDPYNIAISDLQVNGQTPSTITTAMTLLASIFGT